MENIPLRAKAMYYQARPHVQRVIEDFTKVIKILI
jgi:hypothetical protein